jgi:ADP-ribose pyrophosphatase YjhB (NUDIX family)
VTQALFVGNVRIIMDLRWLEWGQKIQAIAQNGLAYTDGVFDRERYKSLQVIAAEILATYTNVEPSYVLDLFSQEVGYATPKVAVRSAVFCDDSLLFVRERSDGCWTVPGGWVDVGESPSEAIVREVYEESGYETRAIKLLGVYDNRKHGYPPSRHQSYKLFILCELLGGSPSPNIEIDQVKFFGENEIPELSLARVTPTQISRLFEHYRHPDWPTDFD